MKFDEIGFWSELKLEIVESYAKQYSIILTKQNGLSHAYVDGFSGPGSHISKSTGVTLRAQWQRDRVAVASEVAVV